ncbi:hypothetical protein Pfo_022611 [Paulownia fortunei]|nr:hypothetical protein Pfo_022611 [Paulownia fortunei]
MTMISNFTKWKKTKEKNKKQEQFATTQKLRERRDIYQAKNICREFLANLLVRIYERIYCSRYIVEMSSGEVDTGTAIAIIFCAIIAVFASVCVLNACNRRPAAPPPAGGAGTGTSSQDKDGNMVVLDGVEVAEAVVEIQGCCCGGGGGGDGGDGGGCGGCGGD